MKKLTFLLVFGLAALHFTAEKAEAGYITSLFNTGIGSDGLRLADGMVDPHYSLIQVPAGSGLGTDAFTTDSSKFPIASRAWLANTATSGWISPTADQSTFANDIGGGVAGAEANAAGWAGWLGQKRMRMPQSVNRGVGSTKSAAR